MAIRVFFPRPDRAFQPVNTYLDPHRIERVAHLYQPVNPSFLPQIQAAYHPTVALHSSLSDPAHRCQAQQPYMVAELLQLVIEVRDLNRQSISILKTLQQSPSPRHILVQATRANAQTTCDLTNLAVEDFHLPQQEIEEVSVHSLLVDAVVPTNTVAASLVSVSSDTDVNQLTDDLDHHECFHATVTTNTIATPIPASAPLSHSTIFLPRSGPHNAGPDLRRIFPPGDCEVPTSPTDTPSPMWGHQPQYAPPL
jgi:hypothetical protein